MSNDNIKLLEFLDLNCDDLELINIEIKPPSLKIITVAKVLKPTFCPVCGTRMHSKGFTTHKANHSILQDGFSVQVITKARRWTCQNSDCRHKETDSFIFLDKYKHTTKVTDISILRALKAWDRTTASVARQFNTSDTYVFELFDMYFDPVRLPLPEILSIDEVYIKLNRSSKYALVLNDFQTGEPIDMVYSRQDDVTEKYFAGIPAEERSNVKYLVTDMYKPYLSYVKKYFPNAVAVVDSFHIVSALIRALNDHLIKLEKAIKADREKANEERRKKHLPKLGISGEEYLLRRFRWILLKNQDNIRYYTKTRYNHKFKRYMNTYDYEELFFKISPELRPLRDLKEKYIRFNSTYLDDPEGASSALDRLIDEYSRCEYEIFQDFAVTLKKYRKPIINSFMTVTRTVDGTERSVRLSNGPIEGMNRFVKDMKRNSRGFKNFYHLRRRFLYSRRSEGNAPLLGSPRSRSEIHNNTGKKRGPYNKN